MAVWAEAGLAIPDLPMVNNVNEMPRIAHSLLRPWPFSKFISRKIYVAMQKRQVRQEHSAVS
jgi:hypothetical protein